MEVVGIRSSPAEGTVPLMVAVPQRGGRPPRHPQRAAVIGGGHLQWMSVLLVGGRVGLWTQQAHGCSDEWCYVLHAHRMTRMR